MSGVDGEDLGEEVDANTGAIATETTNRETADTALATRIDDRATSSRSRDTALGSRINKNSARIDQNEQGIKDALALSIAIPSDYISQGKNFSIAAGLGFTDGAEALGVTGTFRFNENFTSYIGGSTLFDNDTGSNDWAAKTGVRYEW